MPDSTAPVIWIDVETTGLDPRSCDLLEIAAVVTVGSDYEPVDEGVAVTIHPQRFADLSPADAVANVQAELQERARAGDKGAGIVHSMHTVDGLFDDISEGKCVSLGDADATVHEYLAGHLNKREAIMGGNSITLDRNFLELHAPKTFGHLHYRSLDCTSVFEMVRRLPGVGPDYHLEVSSDGAAHRAMADILVSIKQARMMSALLGERVPVGA